MSMSIKVKQSAVWLHFIKTNNKKAFCKICKKTLSIKGGSYGNLSRHLKTQHHIFIVKTPAPAIVINPSTNGQQNRQENMITTGQRQYGDPLLVNEATISDEDDWDTDPDLQAYDRFTSSSLVETEIKVEADDIVDQDSDLPGPAYTKRRRADYQSLEMTPYERAMIKLTKERTKAMERIASRRLNLLQRIAEDNASYHTKMLDLLANRIQFTTPKVNETI